MIRITVVRPEPGNTATAIRARALGYDVVQCPFFAVRALAWAAPCPRDYDALIVTSANAVRHGGAGLDTLKALPVVAVGGASAAAARAAGFQVVATGSGDAVAAGALAAANGFARVLHIGARDRVAIPGADAVSVYASEPLPLSEDIVAVLHDRIVLLHSARAAIRLGELADDRARVGIAALSAQVADAAGPDWDSVRIASATTDAALLDTLARD